MYQDALLLVQQQHDDIHAFLEMLRVTMRDLSTATQRVTK